MAGKMFLRLFPVFLLVFFTAGCIGPEDVRIPDAGPVQEDVKTPEAGPGPETGENLSVNVSDIPPVPETPAVSERPSVPEIPVYSENRSTVVYPKKYRLLSLNFIRATDSDSERVSQEVHTISGKESGYNIEDVCAVFDYVNRRWEYRYDPKAEFFFTASNTIADGYEGDCDDYSIVMSALMKNMGFNTRIIVVDSVYGGHAYPEIYIGDSPDSGTPAFEISSYVAGRYPSAENVWCSTRELEEGTTQYWLNLDWSGSNGYLHPGGAYARGPSVAYYPSGLIEF